MNIELTNKELVTIFLSLVHSSLDDYHGTQFKESCATLSERFQKIIHEEANKDKTE